MRTNRSRRTDRLSVILPIAIKTTGRDGYDLQRARILLESFLLTFSQSDLHRFWIVSPPSDTLAVASMLRSITHDPRFELISEVDLCPELATDPPTRSRWPRPNKGWFRQQLIKLSCCELVETALFLTFDSDIICVRRCGLTDLIVDGKARCGVETRADYDELYVPWFAEKEEQVKQTRVDWAARVLRVGRPEHFRGRFYSETPNLYDTDGLSRMSEFLETTYQKPWRQALIDALPWTEQALFFHFLETQGLLDAKYVTSHRNTILRLDQSLWQPRDHYRDRANRQLEEWQPRNMFDDDSEGFFVAFQSVWSSTAAGLESAWSKIKRQLSRGCPSYT